MRSTAHLQSSPHHGAGAGFADFSFSRRSLLAAAAAGFGTALLADPLSILAAERAEARYTPETLGRCLRSNVRIRLATDGNNTGYGSGTVVSLPEGYKKLLFEGESAILTAGHNSLGMNQRTRIIIEIFDGYDPKSRTFPDKFTSCEARLVGHHNLARNESDLSLLAFKPEKTDYEKGRLIKAPLSPAGTHYESGRDILMIGCPEGKVPDWTYTKIVHLNVHPSQPPMLITSGKRIPGHSGGGAFLPDGSLTAVCSSTSRLSGKSMELPVKVNLPEQNLSAEALTRLYEERAWSAAPAWLRERERGHFVPADDIYKFLDGLLGKQDKIFGHIRSELNKDEYTGLNRDQALEKLEQKFRDLTPIIPEPDGAIRDFRINLDLFRLHEEPASLKSLVESAG